MSLGALAGYSLLVRAPASLASSTEADRREANRLRFEPLAPPQAEAGNIADEPNMCLVDLDCDVLVAGGGMAGVCAALAAARDGARTVLVQDRSRLGGNASSEIRMHIVGADCHGHRAGWRESGIIEELRLEDAVWNPHRAFELWDLMLYDKCVSEPNLKLLLDTAIYRVQTRDGVIERARARCDKTEHLYQIRSKLYVDSTGDSRLALEAGADYRIGHEDKLEFAESLAPAETTKQTQGSSILFTARKHDGPIPFRPPQWARKITTEDLRYRGVGNSWEYGYWWIELGGMYDTIRDNERLRFELLAIVLGVWDYIKNSGKYPSAANWALESIGMIPGKRESRRLMGDLIFTQHEVEGGWKKFTDGVAIGGWGMDEHPPEGFDEPTKRPFVSTPVPEPYNIPFGALYSRNIGNLLMAGRNISCSHVGFTTTRVMATCAVIGQAVGTAAAFCASHNLLPRALRSDAARLKEFQQLLLRNDQSIREIRNEDPGDLARHAKVSASASTAETKPENILTGVTRDLPGRMDNRWFAPLQDQPVWLELAWTKPVKLRQVQIIFDTGFHRQLTLSASNSVTKTMIRAPQPETVKDYSVVVRTADGREVTVADVKDNYLRLRRHVFEPLDALAVRIICHATNGAPEARVYEVRCYA